MTSGIFICYRREDAAGHAGRLFDRLKRHFGPDKIFMDVSGSIEPGDDFVEAIENAVASSDALLVMIGREWLRGTDDAGRRRLDDPSDFIRLEAAAALGRGVRVIPVLVDGAKMPRPDELPADLQPLARRHALEISDERWDFDVERLIDTLQKKPEKPVPPEPPEPRSESVPAWMKRALFAILVFLGCLMMIQLELGRQASREPSPAAAESELITVPDLVGRNLRNAAAMLERAGLQPGRVHEEAGEERRGTVLWQEPPAGGRVQPGAPVEVGAAAEPPVEPPPPGEPTFERPELELLALAGEEPVKHLRVGGGDHFGLLVRLGLTARQKTEIRLAVDPPMRDLLEIPPSVTVPPGEHQVPLEVLTHPVDEPVWFTIVARLGRARAEVEIELVPPE